MSEKVELIPAFQWDCPECGRENFARGIVLEASSEEVQALREKFGVEPGEEGCFMGQPTEVTCAHCDELFETEHFPPPH